MRVTILHWTLRLVLTDSCDDGIVVEQRWALTGKKGTSMSVTIPSVLAVRLGPDACNALVDVFDAERQDGRNDVLSLVSERFERRLIEEGAKFRVELATLGSDIRQEMARDRFELLKWIFLFWVSQLAAMSAIMSFLLHK